MIYVAFMTFVLIMSSVTMVLAVDAGHHLKQQKVAVYMFLTIIGGIIFGWFSRLGMGNIYKRRIWSCTN